MSEQEKPRGPRGGTTTRTVSGQVKKNLWIPAEDAESLRRLAYQTNTPEAEHIRRALAPYLREVEDALALAAVLKEGADDCE